MIVVEEDDVIEVIVVLVDVLVVKVYWKVVRVFPDAIIDVSIVESDIDVEMDGVDDTVSIYKK